jgi:hypothetical protein
MWRMTWRACPPGPTVVRVLIFAMATSATARNAGPGTAVRYGWVLCEQTVRTPCQALEEEEQSGRHVKPWGRMEHGGARCRRQRNLTCAPRRIGCARRGWTRRRRRLQPATLLFASLPCRRAAWTPGARPDRPWRASPPRPSRPALRRRS